jgi:hypothetical protein
MNLYTYCNTNDKFIYGTAVNGQNFFFFSGFASAEEAKSLLLSHAGGISKTILETTLNSAEWSRIK